MSLSAELISRMQAIPPGLLSQWGYWAILLLSFFESSPFAGMVVPGEIVVMLGGLLARMGLLDLWWVIAVSVAGAVLGDLAGYLLGRRYGHGVVKRYGKYFFLKEQAYAKVEGLMREHTLKTIIIGRYNKLTRSFAPFVAGAGDVPFWRFLSANLIGGISWGVLYVLVGFLFGEGFDLAARTIGIFLAVATVIALALIFGYRFLNRRYHIFSRVHLAMLMLAVASVYLFSKMLEDVLDHEWITHADIWVSAHIGLVQTPLLVAIAKGLTFLGSSRVMVPVSVALFLALLFYRRRRDASLFGGAMLFGLASETAVKLLVHRARPLLQLVATSGYSFPSGHATMAALFVCLVLWIFRKDLSPLLRALLSGLGVALFLAIGASRIWLNVHWTSDVLAGFGLGLFVFSVAALVAVWVERSGNSISRSVRGKH